jgi:hypothetical protein
MTAEPASASNMQDDLREGAERFDALYRDKARAELADVFGAHCAVTWHGDVLAEVLLVKGEPGPEDVGAGFALAGADGEAITKALDALGADGSRFALCSRAFDAPESGRYQALRRAVEAVDPSTVIALDGEAAADLATALGIEAIVYGTPITVDGRTVLAVDGFERSLGDETRKRAVWTQLRALSPKDS